MARISKDGNVAEDTESGDTTAAAVTRAADVLYAAAPDEFMSLRTDLSRQARKSGDAQAAKRIGALRKPTVAASAVNRLVHDDPTAVERLDDLGARMREAQGALDATLLRDLSTERRALVEELCRAALKQAEQRNASTAVKDEIAATFDAAVADPDIARRLGYLQRSAQWSGFGFAETGAPELTLVRGGKDASVKPSRRDTSKQDTTPKMPAATRRRIARALGRAQSAFDSADTSLTTAESGEQAESERVRTLTSELGDLQAELDDAKRDLERARREVKSARARRREARSALDRAQRQVAD